MTKLTLLTLAISLPHISLSEEPAKDKGAGKAPLVRPGELSFSKLFVDAPETRGELSAKFLGNWSTKLGGEWPVQLSFRKTEEGFTGIFRYKEDGQDIVAPLVRRQTTGETVKFVVPLDNDTGEISFELALAGEALKGRARIADDPGGEFDVTFEGGGGAAVSDKTGPEGNWLGSPMGMSPLKLRLQKEEKGLAGVATVSVYDEDVEARLTDVRPSGERIKFAVSEGGEVLFKYELLIEGSILTGYRMDGEGLDRKTWVAFERIDPPEKGAGGK